MLTFWSMLSDELALTVDLPHPPDFARLGEHLPYEWVEAALTATDKASIRHRRLPAEQVVWLVIGLAIYRYKSVKEIVDSLDLAFFKPEEKCITSGATTQARQRLGPEPLKWLFETSAIRWIEQDQAKFLFNGLHLLAMDGTTLRLADSAANREHYGAQSYANRTVSSHPQSKGVTLMMVATQLVRDARFGVYKSSELSFAHELLPSVPDDSLTIVDRGFLSAELLVNLVRSGQNRHFLIPSKSNTKWSVVSGSADDSLVEMDVSAQARKKDPTLPKTWQARALRVADHADKISYLLTSLTDNEKFKAADIIESYNRRWRIETSYRELKQTMLGAAITLRSMTVKGTEQEIWGALLAYNLIRVEMAKAALEAKCEPTEISFTLALSTIQTELMMIGPETAQGKIPAILKRLRERLVLELKARRPNRKFERVVKRVPQRYPERSVKKSAN